MKAKINFRLNKLKKDRGRKFVEQSECAGNRHARDCGDLQLKNIYVRSSTGALHSYSKYISKLTVIRKISYKLLANF